MRPRSSVREMRLWEFAPAADKRLIITTETGGSRGLNLQGHSADGT